MSKGTNKRNKKRSYQLINPVIEGDFKDVYDGSEPINAADDMWKNLSQYVVSHVPKFLFSMRELSSGDLHHFQIKEDKETGTYTINKLDINVDKKLFDDFLKRVDDYSKERDTKNGQTAGKRKRYEDEDDSSSSSSSDVYPTFRRTSPITMFNYNSGLYYAAGGPIQTFPSTMNPQLVAVTTPIFTPIFKPTLGTFIGIWP